MLEFSSTAGLFESFEVNREPFWPRVRWLLVGSIVWHLFAMFVIVMVPQVRNTLAIATIFSDSSFVDRPYDKTEIENLGEITELTTEKLYYPEGYFQVANGEMPFPEPSPTPPMMASVPFTPVPMSPTQLDPVAMPSPSATASPLAASNATPTPTPNAEQDAARMKAEEELDKVAAENGVKRPNEINTRPFTDLLKAAKKRRDEKQLNLDGVIELTVDADRSPDGKLMNAKVTDKRGDKVLEITALEFIAALSDSGVLIFLEDAKHLRVSVKLDQTTVEIVAATEVDSEERARQLERTYGLMIVLGRLAKQGKDEEVYYNHTQVSSKEKEVSVKFAMPRAEMGAILSKYAAEK
jgi:hypothetical protein